MSQPLKFQVKGLFSYRANLIHSFLESCQIRTILFTKIPERENVKNIDFNFLSRRKIRAKKPRTLKIKEKKKTFIFESGKFQNPSVSYSRRHCLEWHIKMVGFLESLNSLLNTFSNLRALLCHVWVPLLVFRMLLRVLSVNTVATYFL